MDEMAVHCLRSVTSGQVGCPIRPQGVGTGVRSPPSSRTIGRPDVTEQTAG